MRARWFWGIIILAILALLWALFTAPDRSAAMGDDIRNALRSAGSNAEVDMNGNVATLTGVAKSDDEMARATSIAENAECSACEGKKRWHKVRNDMSLAKAPAKKVVALPRQSPYTFQATKDANGNVVVNGYVRNEAERKRVLAHANALYPGKVTNRTVRLASGAPNADWENVLIGNLDDLKKLDTGRLTMENASTVITGTSLSTGVRDAINSRIGSLANYDGAATITVPDAKDVNVGEIKSQAICQTLLNDIKTGKKINFAVNKADIKGDQSFDLLNSLASAAKQCAAFRINVEGHTDSDGSDEYNQRLSEARANTVVAYLTQNGIARERMQAIGLGEAKPIGDNTTNEGKARNRRIEFVVTQSE